MTTAYMSVLTPATKISPFPRSWSHYVDRSPFWNHRRPVRFTQVSLPRSSPHFRNCGGAGTDSGNWMGLRSGTSNSPSSLFESPGDPSLLPGRVSLYLRTTDRTLTGVVVAITLSRVTSYAILNPITKPFQPPLPDASFHSHPDHHRVPDTR